MKNKLIIVIGLIILFFIIKSFIHSDEQQIRELANNITKEASFATENLHPFVYLQKGKELATHFSKTTAVEINFDGEFNTKLFGHQEIIKQYTLARNHLDKLQVKFDKLKIEVTKTSATINTTIIVGITKRGASEELFAEPIIITVEKNTGEWLVSKIRNIELLEK